MSDLLAAMREKLSGILPKESVSYTIKLPNFKPAKSFPDEWGEREINRWLKDEFSLRGQKRHKGWLRFIRYISIEFEEQNQVRLLVATNAFIRLHIEAELSDLWHDFRTSSVSFTLKSLTLLGVPLLPQFLSRWLTHFCMSMAGFIFNPIALNKGVLTRFTSSTICFDFHNYFRQCEYTGVTKYLVSAEGELKSDFIIFGADTYRGAIKPKIHRLSDEFPRKWQDRRINSVSRSKGIGFGLKDVGQLLLVAVVAFLTVLLVRPFFSGIPTISLSWSFLTSLIALLISMSLVNAARWIYQFYWQSKRNFILFRAEEMRYRIDRIKRDVELEMDKFRRQTNETQLESDLLRAGIHRLRILMLQERIENLSREIKLKYFVAYVITIVSEYLAFYYF